MNSNCPVELLCDLNFTMVQEIQYPVKDSIMYIGIVTWSLNSPLQQFWIVEVFLTQWVVKLLWMGVYLAQWPPTVAVQNSVWMEPPFVHARQVACGLKVHPHVIVRAGQLQLASLQLWYPQYSEHRELGKCDTQCIRLRFNTSEACH